VLLHFRRTRTAVPSLGPTAHAHTRTRGLRLKAFISRGSLDARANCLAGKAERASCCMPALRVFLDS